MSYLNHSVVNHTSARQPRASMLLGVALATSLVIGTGSAVAMAAPAKTVEKAPAAIEVAAESIELTSVDNDGFERLDVSDVIDQIGDEAREQIQQSEKAELAKKKAAKCDKILATAKSLKGTPYVYGGSSPKGFDCSGFTSYVYKKHGVKLTHNAQAQYYETKSVSKKHMKPGDLVFFGWGKDCITHVGIYVGNGKYIHSPQSGERVRIEKLSKRTNFVAATRVI